jgi:hypothetical protein
VASLLWLLERLPFPHLRHGGATTDRAATRARRAVTAPVCARVQRRAGRGRPGKAVGRVGRGRARPSWATRALRRSAVLVLCN